MSMHWLSRFRTISLNESELTTWGIATLMLGFSVVVALVSAIPAP